MAGPPRPRRRPLHRAARRPLRGGDHVLQRAVARPAADDRVRGRRLRAVLQPGPAGRDPRRDHRGRAGQPGRARSTRSSTRPSTQRARSAAFGLLGALYSGHRVDDEPARGALGAVGAGRRSRPRCPSGCCSTCWRCSGSGSRWSARSRSPGLASGFADDGAGVRRAGRAGLGAVPADAARRRARPRRQLADLPVGDRPAAARARRRCAARSRRRCSARSGSRCSSR